MTPSDAAVSAMVGAAVGDTVASTIEDDDELIKKPPEALAIVDSAVASDDCAKPPDAAVSVRVPADTPSETTVVAVVLVLPSPEPLPLTSTSTLSPGPTILEAPAPDRSVMKLVANPPVLPKTCKSRSFWTPPRRLGVCCPTT